MGVMREKGKQRGKEESNGGKMGSIVPE